MQRHSRRLGIGIAAIAVAGLALVGCSGSSTPAASPSPSKTDNGVAALSAREIWSKSDAAVMAQSSVRMKAEGTEYGDPLLFDISVTKASGGSGTLTQGKSGQIEFVANPSNVWVRGGRSFWTLNYDAATADFMGNRWLKVPANTAKFHYLAEFGSYDSAMSGFMKPKGKTITKGAQVDLDGQPAVTLKSGTVEMWIATTGEPLLLQQKGVFTEGADTQTAKTSEWGTATVAAPPPDSDTVDESKLPASAR